MNKLLILIAISIWFTACQTAPLEDPEVETENVFAKNVDVVTESIHALENTLVCSTWTVKNIIARPIVNALQVIPFFSDVPQPCIENAD